MSWIEYWNTEPTIYAGDRHKVAHYRSVAAGIVSHLPHDGLVVLDDGCGEALYAADIASRTAHLYLCDAAPVVRAGLSARLGDVDNVTVLSPARLRSIAPGSVDLIVANSMIQYLGPDDLTSRVHTWRRLLSPRGRILLADVIPRGVGPAKDAVALLAFAAREKFLASAVGGLVRTFFSSYRRLRHRHGLLQLDEPDVVALLGSHGLAAARVHPNLGHNQARMAFVAMPQAVASGVDVGRVMADDGMSPRA